MKKTIKIIIIDILVLVLIYLASKWREAIIINKFSNKVMETQKLTNYYYKAQTENGINIAYRKDDKSIWRLESELNNRQICVNGDEVWLMVEDNKDNSKTAVKVSANEGFIMPTILMDGSLYVENFWQAFLMSFISRITTEEVNNISCYKIYMDEDFQVFVNKQDYIKIKEINGSTSRELLEYSINTVTDLDVELPNLEEFKIIKGN